MKCLRCDWHHDRELVEEVPAREQLRAHVEEAGHPVCLVCRHVLGEHDVLTCESCLTEARSLLSGIVTMWLELPLHLGQLHGAGPGGTRAASDGRPLPGGDVLVLLGPGSIGDSEDGETTRDNDPTSVAFDLTWWEARWRRERREGEARPARLGQAVRRAAGYLEVHTRWAAQHLDGFDDYVSDLRILHGRLERATGRDQPTARANASCFDCGGTLVRRMEEVTVQRWWVQDAVGPLPALVRWTGSVESAEVVCNQCRRRYSPQEYLLALRFARSSGLEGWVVIADAAKVTHRSVETIESWSKRGLVTAACAFTLSGDRVVPGRKLVWWPDVDARVLASQQRKRVAS